MTLESVCREAVGHIDGAVGCGVISLSSGELSAKHQENGDAPPIDGETAKGVQRLFRSRSVQHVGGLLKKHRGVVDDDHPVFEEFHIASATAYHFAKVIAHGNAAVLLVTSPGVNIGMGWAQLRSVVPKLEAELEATGGVVAAAPEHHPV